MPNSVDMAKRVLAADEAGLYGIFGIIGTSGYFPPRAFLNEFLERGYDPCDQDGRIDPWAPFTLTADEYVDVLSWWSSRHPGAVEDALGVESWQDWEQRIIGD